MVLLSVFQEYSIYNVINDNGGTLYLRNYFYCQSRSEGMSYDLLAIAKFLVISLRRCLNDT